MTKVLRKVARRSFSKKTEEDHVDSFCIFVGRCFLFETRILLGRTRRLRAFSSTSVLVDKSRNGRMDIVSIVTRSQVPLLGMH